MIYFLFFLLIVITSSDLNSFVSSLIGQDRALSYIILLISGILFIKAVQIKIKLAPLSKWLAFIIIFWLSYGTLLYYMSDINYGNPIARIRYYLPSLFLLFTFSILISFYINQGILKKIIDIISISLLINCLLIIYSGIKGNLIGLEIGVNERSSGLIASVNQAGVTASIAQSFFLYQYLISHKTKRNRYLLIILYSIAAYAGFLTFSKAAIINILLIFILFIVYLKKNAKHEQFQKKILKQNYKVIIIILVSGLLFGIFAGQKFYKNLSKIQQERLFEISMLFSGKIDSETTTNRSDIAKIALRVIHDDYYLGRGLSTFHSLPQTGGLGTHNEFLLLFGELGIIGLLFYLIYFYSIYRNLFKVKFIPNRFLLFSLSNIIFITSMVSHNVFFIKMYILIFAFLNVFIWYNKIDSAKVVF